MQRKQHTFSGRWVHTCYLQEERQHKEGQLNTDHALYLLHSFLTVPPRQLSALSSQNNYLFTGWLIYGLHISFSMASQLIPSSFLLIDGRLNETVLRCQSHSESRKFLKSILIYISQLNTNILDKVIKKSFLVFLTPSKISLRTIHCFTFLKSQGLVPLNGA